MIQVNNCISTITIADIISRISFPLISNTLKLSSRFSFIFGVVGLASMRFAFLYLNLENYKLFLLFCAMLGFFRAITVVNQVLVLCDFCEENCATKLPGTLGLSVVLKAALLVFFEWTFNGLWQVSTQLYLHFYFHILLYLIVIMLWILEDESSSNSAPLVLRIEENMA